MNLLCDPFVPVTTVAGGAEELSLLDVLLRAPELTDLAGDNPLATVALRRLMVAFLYAALPCDTSDDWEDAYAERAFDATALQRYAEEWGGRFELRGDAPFYQTPGSRAPVKPLFGVDPASASPGAARNLQSRLRPQSRLTAAQAARWLISMQVSDVAGIKSGDPQDPTVTAGKGYGGGLGWVAALANTWPIGPTLFDSLILARLPDRFCRRDPERDRPAWERAVSTWHYDVEYAPAGPVQALTIQGRRILLSWDDDEVVGAAVAKGDKASPVDMQHVEPYTTWRVNKSASAKAKRGVQVPNTYAAPAQSWRGMASLFPTPVVVDKEYPVAQSLLLAWLSEVSELLPEQPMGLNRTVAVLGPQNAVLDDVISDDLRVPVCALPAGAGETRQLLRDVTTLASQAAADYGRFVSRLYLAQGGSGGSRGADANLRRDLGTRGALRALDGPVRAWIASLGPEDELLQARRGALEMIRSVVRAAAKRELEATPSTAWTASDEMNPARAEAMLRAALRKLDSGGAAPSAETEEE